jgi:dienelactone hydrolase
MAYGKLGLGRRGTPPAWRLLLGCLLAAVFTWAGAARASTDRVYDTSIDTHAMRLWLPGGVPVIRGVVVYINGAGGDSRGIVSQQVWQEFSRTHGFGVLGSQGFGRHATTGEGQLLLDGLARFATLSGQPELEHVPFLMAGFSNGGQYAYEFNAWRPERVIAFDVNKGGFYDTLLPQAGSLKTPGILIAGEQDTQTRHDAIKRLFTGNRPRGALWAFVVEEDAAHCECASNDLLLPFFARAIALRYPADQSPRYGPVTLRDVSETGGWLADPTTVQSGLTSIQPYTSYPGDRSAASWLLDADTAHVFRAFSTQNNPLLLNDQGVSSMGAFATLTVNASAFPGWRRVEFFQGATKLGEVTSGTLSWTGRFSTGTYGLSVLGTDAAGTVRTAKPQALVVQAANESSDLFEAERAALAGALVDNSRGGYSGSGYADFQNNSGDSIEWTVVVPSAGTHLLTFRHALFSGDRPLELRVNGQVVNPSLSFPSTGSFNTWANVTAQVALVAGANTVRLTTIGFNGSNVDSVRVSAVAPSVP